MKFEEKLMKLRKGKAMSQEELAEKLEVTRQTVSKWELGQTTPDMEKMKKIAEIFETSVNDLCDENVNTECIKNVEKGKSNNNVTIAIIIIVLILSLMGLGVLTVKAILNYPKKMMNTVIDATEDGGLIDKFIDLSGKIENKIDERMDEEDYDDQMKEKIENSQNIISSATAELEKNDKIIKSGATNFNNKFESLYYGSTMGGFMNNFIDEVIKSNSKNPENIITVSFDGIETSNADELRSMKSKFSTFSAYDIIYEYDANGFINRATITL